MKILGRRPVSDPAELGTVVAECLTHLEPGLTLVDGSASAGDVSVELTAVADGGRLVLILCDIVGGPETVLRAPSAPSRPTSTTSHPTRRASRCCPCASAPTWATTGSG